jgi:amino acid adenylation domain-containing protein
MVKNAGRLEGYPLSKRQVVLWELHRRSFLQRAQAQIHIFGEVDPELLRTAADELVLQHEILRTRFRRLTGLRLPLQCVEDTGQARWEDKDLRSLNPREQIKAAEALAHEATREPVNLSEDELLHSLLLRLSSNEWRLVLTLPAIVSDLSSLGILFRALIHNYGWNTGELPQLPMAPQFLDVARLIDPFEPDGVGDTLDLRSTLPEEAAQWRPDEFEPAIQRFVLPRRFSCLSDANIQHETALLLGCWQILFRRLNRQASFRMGLYGRQDCSSQTLGPLSFVRTLTSEMMDDMTFSEVIERAFAELELFRTELSPPDNSSPVPHIGFEAVAADRQLKAGGTVFSMESAWSYGEPCGLLLSCWLGQRQEFQLHYDRNRVRDETIRRWGKFFLQLLRQSPARHRRSIDALPLMTRREERKVAALSRGTPQSFRNICIHHSISQMASFKPEQVAVRCRNRAITYGELDSWSNQLAWRLRSLGVGPGHLLGLCEHRSIEMLVGVLGILKTGGAFVPIGLYEPPNRRDEIIAESGINLLVTVGHLVTSLSGWGLRLIPVDSIAVRQSPGGPVEITVHPESAAYLLYTSGSTGRPKGILVEHRNVMNYLSWFNMWRASEGVPAPPMISSLSFDGSLKQWLAPLVQGETTELVPLEVSQDACALLTYLLSKSPASLSCVPSLWEVLLHTIESGEHPPLGQSLHSLLLGGEVVTPDILRRTAAIQPSTKVFNFYGPTETTGSVSFSRVEDCEEITIGRPISNVSFYVLDSAGQLVPPGIQGELHIGGAGVARCYHRLTSLTAERFLPDQFSTVPGSRLFRTGDLVSMKPDGNFRFHQRLDNQLKIRGVIVEPAEIIAVFKSHPVVIDAAVVGKDDARGMLHLIAYVVLERFISEQQFLTFLRERLPMTMIPHRIVQLDSLPRGPSGKVDIAALPVPDFSAQFSIDSYKAPQTATEKRLVKLWERLLGVSEFDIEADFFTLGGHSLLATMLINQVRESFGVELPLRIFLERPTIAALAAVIDKFGADSRDQFKPIKMARTQPFPLSVLQERMLQAVRIMPGQPVLNMIVALELKGPLDYDALAKAYEALQYRHESLRTVFVTSDEKPAQLVSDNILDSIQTIELSNLESQDTSATALQLASAIVQVPFDFERGPLIHTLLFRISSDCHLLFFVLNHIIADGLSLDILIRECALLYESHLTDETPPLPEVPIQLADFTVWQRDWLRSPEMQTQFDFWRNALTPPLTKLTLSTRAASDVGSDFRGGWSQIELGSHLSKEIRLLSRKHAATTFMTVLSAFAALLYRKTGCPDVRIGTEVATRNLAGADAIIGLMINTLILRVDLASNPSFSELLARVREIVLAAFSHQDIPFDVLAGKLASEGIERESLFEVMLVFRTTPLVSIELPELSIKRIRINPGLLDIPYAPAPFPLLLYIEDGAQEMTGYLEYDTNTINSIESEHLLRNFKTLLQQVVIHPGRAIADLPLSELS